MEFSLPPADFQWEEGSYTMKEIGEKFATPLIVQCDVTRSPVPCQQFNFDLSQPLLFYKKRKIQKVPARSLTIDKEKYVEIGDSLLIPEDYKGWFAVLNRPGDSAKADDSVPHFKTVEEIANSNTERFLIGGTQKIAGLHILDRSDIKLKHQQRPCLPGDVFTKGKIYLGDTKKKSRWFRKPKYVTEKFLMCRDESDREVLLPYGQKGIFYEISSSKHAKVGRQIMQMSDIVARNLPPRIVKLVFGRFPITPCAFTGLMKLEMAELERSVVSASVMNFKNIMLELPINSCLYFHVAVMDDKVTSHPGFQNAMALCGDKTSSYMKNIKVCYNFADGTVIPPLSDSPGVRGSIPPLTDGEFPVGEFPVAEEEHEEEPTTKTPEPKTKHKHRFSLKNSFRGKGDKDKYRKSGKDHNDKEEQQEEHDHQDKQDETEQDDVVTEGERNDRLKEHERVDSNMNTSATIEEKDVQTDPAEIPPNPSGENSRSHPKTPENDDEITLRVHGVMPANCFSKEYQSMYLQLEQNNSRAASSSFSTSSQPINLCLGNSYLTVPMYYTNEDGKSNRSNLNSSRGSEHSGVKFDLESTRCSSEMDSNKYDSESNERSLGIEDSELEPTIPDEELPPPYPCAGYVNVVGDNKVKNADYAEPKPGISGTSTGANGTDMSSSQTYFEMNTSSSSYLLDWEKDEALNSSLLPACSKGSTDDLGNHLVERRSSEAPNCPPPPRPVVSTSSSSGHSSMVDEIPFKRNSTDSGEYAVPKMQTQSSSEAEAPNSAEEYNDRRPSTYMFNEFMAKSKDVVSKHVAISEEVEVSECTDQERRRLSSDSIPNDEDLFDDDEPIYENIEALKEIAATLRRQSKRSKSHASDDIARDLTLADHDVDSDTVSSTNESDDLPLGASARNSAFVEMSSCSTSSAPDSGLGGFEEIELEISKMSTSQLAQALVIIGIKGETVCQLKEMSVDGKELVAMENDEGKTLRENLPDVGLIDLQKISMFLKGWRPNQASK